MLTVRLPPLRDALYRTTLRGKQESHAYRAERDQSCAFGLKCGQALFTHEPGADPHVKMQPILDDLAFGNALEEQSRAHT